jgi:hypothetical protein
VAPLLGLTVLSRIVRDIVGQANLDVTITIHAHSSLKEKREALQKPQDPLTEVRCCTRFGVNLTEARR